MDKPHVIALDHLVLTVNDLDATVDFYEKVLGMEADWFTPADGTRRCALLFGNQKINLHLAKHEFSPRAEHPTPGSADLCFLSDKPLTAWAAQLAAHGVHVEEGPVKRTGAAGPLLSLYVRDPDHNLIEIAQPAPQR